MIHELFDFLATIAASALMEWAIFCANYGA